jgi:hypothetical protein
MPYPGICTCTDEQSVRAGMLFKTLNHHLSGLKAEVQAVPSIAGNAIPVWRFSK